MPKSVPETATFPGKYTLPIAAGCLLLLTFYVLRNYLLLRDVFLFLDIGSDIPNAYYPYYKHFSEYIRQEGLPMWSFQRGMGQYIFPDVVSSPIMALLYLVSPTSLLTALGYLEWFRMVAAGLLMYWYLREIEAGPLTRLVGSLCYALAGYMVLTSGWYPATGNVQLYLILLLIGIERLLRKDSWWLLPVVVAFITTESPFSLLNIGQFAALYLLARFYAGHFTVRQSMLTTGRIAALSVLGLGMGAVVWTGTIYILLNSPRGSGDVSYTAKLAAQSLFGTADGVLGYTTLLRWFGNDLLGTGNNYRGWSNYMEAPAFYVGLLSLLLFPQLFVLSNRKERLMGAALSSVALALMMFPYLRYAHWAFTGDYYRVLGLLIGLGLLLGSLRVLTILEQGRKLNVWLLGGTLLVLLTLLFTNLTPTLKPFVNVGLRGMVSLYLLGYTALLVLLARTNAAWIKIAMLVLVCVELGQFANITLNKRDVLSRQQANERIGYNDYSREALDYIRARNDGFYRVEKDYASGPAMHSSLNDAMVQNYRGTASYYSFNQKNYIGFLKGFGIIKPNEEFETRWAPGLRNRPLLMSLASVKYTLSKGAIPYRGFGFDSLTRQGDVTVWRNPFALPMGYAYDRLLPESLFRRLSPNQKDVMALNGVVVPDSALTTYDGMPVISDSLPALTFEKIAELAQARRADTLRLTSSSSNQFTGTVAPRKPIVLFFSIPFDAGWKAVVDGKPAPLRQVMFGLTGLPLPAGQHEVHLYYDPPYLNEGIWVSGLAIAIYLGLLAFFRFRSRRTSPPVLSSSELPV